MHKRTRKKYRRNKRKKRDSYELLMKNSSLIEKLKQKEEDVLKYIYKYEKSDIEIKKIGSAFTSINEDMEIIMIELIKNGYIDRKNDSVSLTPRGLKAAKLIFKIHNEIEDYVKMRNPRFNAHRMAHFLEHRLKEGDIDKMIKISDQKDKGVSLPNFKLPAGTIVDVALTKSSIWKKLISVGIFPGQRIHIINRAQNNYLIMIKNSKFAIDKNLAEGIFLIP